MPTVDPLVSPGTQQGSQPRISPRAFPLRRQAAARQPVRRCTLRMSLAARRPKAADATSEARRPPPCRAVTLQRQRVTAAADGCQTAPVRLVGAFTSGQPVV